jgi:redox-sensitive bicupin YhaK (pirin superfamily)
MSGVEFGAVVRGLVRPRDAASIAAQRAAARPVAMISSGLRHGPITRFITPWDTALTTPFVLLDYAELAPESPPPSAIQPHSSIATLTLVLSGHMSFEDTTGRRGEIRAGGFAWTRSTRAVCRGGDCPLGRPLRVFQLWISEPAAEVSFSAASERIVPREVDEDGPVRVLLGQFGRARSRVRGASADINCFHVQLKNGERWRYAAPDGHNVTWLAVDRGGLHLQEGERVYWEQIAVFGDTSGVIEAQADGDTSFILGSARGAHPAGKSVGCT